MKRILRILLAICVVATTVTAGVSPRKEGAWVAIRSGEAHATGFVLDMDGEKFLVSEESIVRRGGPFGLEIPKGMRISLGDFQVAANSSLIRFRLKNDLPAFQIGGNCEEKDPVSLCGVKNLKSGLERIPATIISPGKGEITVDGNWETEMWGGPVLDAEGKVLGVLAEKILSLEDVEWEAIQWKQYHAQTDILHDMGVFLSYAETLLTIQKRKKRMGMRPGDEEPEEEKVVYEAKNRNLFFRYMKLHDYLMSYVQKQKEIQKESKKIPEYLAQIEEITDSFLEKGKNKEPRESEQNMQMRIGLIRTRIKTSEQKIENIKKEMNRARWKTLGEVTRFMSGQKWETARLKREAQKKIEKLQSLSRL